jgi:hypothetical protein
MASLKKMAQRWKQYVAEGKWIYEAHPFWCSGYTFWDIKTEAPDLFLHLSESDLVLFKVRIACYTGHVDRSNSLTALLYACSGRSQPPKIDLVSWQSAESTHVYRMY